MRLLNNFFLSGFKNSTYFEKRKASYLFYIILSCFVFIATIGAGQLYFNLDPLYMMGITIALAGVFTALAFFKYRKVEAAGHILACCGILMVILQTVVRDHFSHDPAIRYRIYITVAGLTGISFIVISFFRDRKYVLFYAVIFELILLGHAMVIKQQLKDIPNMALYTTEHLITVSLGMTVVAAMSTWLLSYMDALFQQNLDYSNRIKSQNEVLEKMVEERTRDLQESNKQLREFAHIASHDLKEPLRIVSGFVTLIKRELEKAGLDNAEMEEYIHFAKQGTEQMDKLIKDILTYSKLNTAEKNFTPVEMEDVITAVKRNLAKSIYENEVEILVTGTGKVLGNKELLEQVFHNLISNAIKYRSDERSARITIGCNRKDGMVQYFVADNGIGIAEQYFEIIFEAFKRLHSKIAYEGTGIGLAICKKIINLHGGEMWIESTEGEGTIFWFSLMEDQTDVPAIQPVVHAA
jgi:signal transduction histidine kinase